MSSLVYLFSARPMITQFIDAIWVNQMINFQTHFTFWYFVRNTSWQLSLLIIHVIQLWLIQKMGKFNSSRPRQHGRNFPDDIFRCIFLNENIWIAIDISLIFVAKGPIDNIPALVQIMAWHRSGNKSLSEPMMINLLRHSASISQPRTCSLYKSCLFHPPWETT